MMISGWETNAAIATTQIDYLREIWMGPVLMRMQWWVVGDGG
jgi:hypothetical protein